jgi:hypothetical protein
MAFQIPAPFGEAEDTVPRHMVATAPALISSADSWTTVRTGLFIYRAGLMVGAPGILATTIVIGMLAIGPDTDPAFRLFNVAAALGVFAALFVLLAGQFLCCSAPRESRARGVMIASVICYALALLGALFFGLSVFGESWNPNNPFVQRHQPLHFRLEPGIMLLVILAALLGFIGHALFATFVKVTAAFFHNKPLARDAGLYLWVFVVFGTAALVICFMLFLHAVDGRAISTAGDHLLLGIAAVFTLFGLAFFLWFLWLTGRVRRTISRALKPIVSA